MIRVFLVDDHHLFLSGVRAELGGEFEIVGEAGEVDAAVDGIRRTRPDVVLLDVHLPGGGGRAVLEAVRQTDQEIRFLALSVSDAAEDVIGVIRAGARGYVTKTISPPDLADAIRRVQSGDAVFSPRLAGFVLDAFHGDLPGVVDPELDQLTPASARSCASSPGLHVQGGRAPAARVGQDGRDPRVVGAAQAPALQPPRADPLGHRPPAGLTRFVTVSLYFSYRIA